MRAAAFFLLLLFGSGTARADISADYAVWGPLGPSMRIQVADNGDARVELGGHLALIRRGGVTYLVRRDAIGMFVLRQDEFERIEGRKDRESGTAMPEIPALDRARLVEAGTESVGGRTGTVLAMAEAGQVPADRSWAWVVCPDPDLRPVGEVLRTVFGGSSLLSPPSLASLTAAVFARGTPIRSAFIYRLERTSHDTVSATAFDLPGPIVTGEVAETRLGPAW